MYSMCFLIISICIILYVYKMHPVNIYGIPLWSILLGILVISSLTNNRECFESKPKVVLYNFNTRWCGYSKRFQPEWDELMKQTEKMNNVSAKDIKCDKENNVDFEANNDLAKKYQVPGFPYIIALVDDNPVHQVYNGPRTSKALVDYVNKLQNPNNNNVNNVNNDNNDNNVVNSGSCSQ